MYGGSRNIRRGKRGRWLRVRCRTGRARMEAWTKVVPKNMLILHGPYCGMPKERHERYCQVLAVDS